MKSFSKFLLERAKLSVSQQFIDTIAEYYMTTPGAGPDDQELIPAYTAISNNINALYNTIVGRGRVQFEWVNDDPYANAQELVADVRNNNRLQIYTGYNTHPFFSPEVNLKFRGIHDYLGHVVGNNPFSYQGEVNTYEAHKRAALPIHYPAYFCEIIGQASVTETTGNFPEQKMVNFSSIVDFETLELK